MPRPKGSKNGRRLAPQEQARRQKLAKKKWDDEKKPERRFRFRKRLAAAPAEFSSGFRVSTPSQLNRPQLKFLDAHGRVRIELELSAEELIRRYKKAARKVAKRRATP